MWSGDSFTLSLHTHDDANARAVVSRPGTLTGHPLGAFLPALAMASIGLIALGLAWMSPQQGGDQYLVLASPVATRGQTLAIILKAGGRLVAEGRLANMALATSTDPDFSVKLKKAGAWIATAAPENGGCLGLLPKVGA